MNAVSDVETILSEIRERVRAEEKQRAMLSAEPDAQACNGSGAGTLDTRQETLERLRAHLTTTARAWERLPPVHSDRSGGPARFELWIKARLKAFSRWFTWEQINFNASVHHALSDAAELLAAQRSELADLRAQLEIARKERQEQQQQQQQEQRAKEQQEQRAKEQREQIARTRSEFEAQHRVMVEEIGVRLRGIESRITEVSDNLRQQQAALIKSGDDGLARFVEIDARLAELAHDLREEQRVCFQQLSLEVSEAAILEDRGRRALEARFEQLEKLRTPP